MNLWLPQLDDLILFAGWGQLALIAGSLAIPRVLGWKEHLAAVLALTRRLFWVYAGYIWGTNLCFGLLSAAAPGVLLGGTPLAACVSAFIAVYWGARLVIQFALFRSVTPAGGWFRLGEAALVLLFVLLTSVYAAAAAANLQSLRT